MSAWKELDMRQRTVIVTGATRGIGKETASQLAKRGCKVILACRDVETTERVRIELVEQSKNEQITVKKLDLNSLESVRGFANEILSSELRLDALICNAGVMYQDQQTTPDGFDCSFSSNYLGHFLLVILLLPLMKKTPSARIIMVSSLLYLYGHVDFQNLNGERSYGKMAMYNDNKLEILLFMKELNARLKGSTVTINSMHPGICMTDLMKTVPSCFLAFVKCFGYFVWNSLEEAARTSVYLAVSADVGGISGKLFGNCKPMILAPHADNDAVAKKLWEVSCKFARIDADQAV